MSVAEFDYNLNGVIFLSRNALGHLVPVRDGDTGRVLVVSTHRVASMYDAEMIAAAIEQEINRVLRSVAVLEEPYARTQSI